MQCHAMGTLAILLSTVGLAIGYETHSLQIIYLMKDFYGVTNILLHRRHLENVDIQ
jgi:hypothetical protein